jgi:SAM-dependent methyltransferase
MNNRESKRFKSAVSLVEGDYKSVLDVGCRDKTLKVFLKNDIAYQGIDFEDSQEVIGSDLEKGIPFPDESFDVVFALDVLEHVDNAQFLFQEIIRVSKKEIVMALPNMYYWKFRLRFLKGKDISDKYIFHTHAQLDRHRWITSYNSALKFVKLNSGNEKMVIKKEFYQYKSKLLKSIDKKLSGKFPNLFVHTVIFHISKR